jgi:excinuclease ABC subunit C
MTRSVLDGIPGLGPTRRKRLVDELGGVRAVQAASLGTLRSLSWLPDQVADTLYEHVHGSRRGRAGPAGPVERTG